MGKNLTHAYFALECEINAMRCTIDEQFLYDNTENWTLLLKIEPVNEESVSEKLSVFRCV
jgi:hypothetical protein